jgi:hypothetical protein
LQGAKLTAWECAREGIPVTVITDSMAAHCIQQKLIDAVIVGADRIAANGDTANKIGTYSLAVVAKAHNLPFYVAAPYRRWIFPLRMVRVSRSNSAIVPKFIRWGRQPFALEMLTFITLPSMLLPPL